MVGSFVTNSSGSTVSLKERTTNHGSEEGKYLFLTTFCPVFLNHLLPKDWLWFLVLTTTWYTSWQELEDYTAEVSVQHESLEGSFTFYDSTKASLNIYQVLLSLVSLIFYNTSFVHVMKVPPTLLVKVKWETRKAKSSSIWPEALLKHIFFEILFLEPLLNLCVHLMFVFVGGERNVWLALASGVRIVLDSALQFPRHHYSGKYKTDIYWYTGVLTMEAKS